MLQKQISGLTARKLRLILISTIVLLILLGGVGFWFAYGKLSEYAETVRQTSAQASLSNENLAVLRRLEAKLATDARAIERTKNIVAESKSYEYQDQIISDLNNYARKAGIGITSFTFSDSGASSGAATPAASTSGTPAPAAATPTAAAGGLKVTNVSVALSGSASYENIMRLIRSIEKNLTKMQLTGITLNSDQASGKVTVNSLTVEVYIR